MTALLETNSCVHLDKLTPWYVRWQMSPQRSRQKVRPLYDVSPVTGHIT